MKKIVVALALCLSTTTLLASPLPTYHRTLAHIKPSMNGFDLNPLLYDKYYFALKNPKTGVINYTRNGNFFYLADGYLVQNGNRLQGYPVPTTVLSNACELSDIKIPMLLPPEATSNIKIEVNLDPSTALPITSFNPNNTMTYNYQVSADAFDTLGSEHKLTLYFVENSVNHWTVYITNAEKIISSTQLTFTSDGLLSDSNDSINLSLDLDNGANTPQTITISLAGSTQFYSPIEVREKIRDGHDTGHLQSIDIDELGDINTKYTSGTTLTLAKIAVFPNAE